MGIMEDKSVPEVKNLIEECLPGDILEVNIDYLKQVLAYPRYQKMTVKEIFEAEHKAMKRMEADFAERKAKREKTD